MSDTSANKRRTFNAHAIHTIDAPGLVTVLPLARTRPSVGGTYEQYFCLDGGSLEGKMQIAIRVCSEEDLALLNAAAVSTAISIGVTATYYELEDKSTGVIAGNTLNQSTFSTLEYPGTDLKFCGPVFGNIPLPRHCVDVVELTIDLPVALSQVEIGIVV